MRIGFNLVFLQPRMAGARVVAVNLAGAILQAAGEHADLRFRVFVTRQGEECLLADRRFRDAAAALASRLAFVRLAVNPALKGIRFVTEQVRLASLSSEIDVMHSFDYTFPYASRCRNIVTIHDLNYLNHPETFGPKQRWFRRISVPLSLRLADRVVTISGSARAEILSRFPLTEPRLVVIHNGYGGLEKDDRQVREPAATLPDTPYVLSVGTLKAHKNYPRLIEAFAGLTDPNLNLVIVGRDDGLADELRRVATGLHVADRVRLPGFVPDSELRALYENASLFVAPSLYEGFGMPVLEAMARGIPVACSNLTVFSEVGGDAATYFDPGDAASIRDALGALLADVGRMESLGRAGIAQAQRFTWESSAEKVLRLYHEVTRSDAE